MSAALPPVLPCLSEDLDRALDRALAVLLPALDIVTTRVDAGLPPAWCESRGFTHFLLSLSDADLARCEAEGLSACIESLPGAPPDLLDLARASADAARVSPLRAAPMAPTSESLRSIADRKRRQLAPLLGAVAPFAARARRIVDVGAGHGHFTRLAADLLDLDALGLERDPDRVTTARTLARGTRATFARFDAFADDLAFTPDDLAFGLHACGELGDRLVTAAAAAPCDLVLVSCCLQKITAPHRLPLSSPARAAGLVLPRETLGLTNLTARSMGVEESLPDMLAMRERRYALLRLLRARGLDVEPGEEMRGQNRRRARDPLRDLAARALAQRGLTPPTDTELREHEAAARVEFARMRRLSLPRNLLSRLTEVAVVLDRAAALEESGHAVEVATAFEAEVTPRNLVILARARRG
ncbi:MAG TPA: methyltransferase [Candidatus Nanopelagicales bacterium]|nr:methyltransferase [Candidatus Nanopelagicales bacterium]